MTGTLSMSVTGSTDERVTTMPTTRSVSLRVRAALGLAPGGGSGQGHHRERAAHVQVQQRGPVLVDGDLARPVCPWQPPGEHLGHVHLVPEPPIGGHLGRPPAEPRPAGWMFRPTPGATSATPGSWASAR